MTDSAETLLVAIDGPAGSGKSSVAREVASRLGFGMLDTGAGYRSLTWACLEQGVNLDDEAAVRSFMNTWQELVSLTLKGEQRVVFGDTDITAAIREPELSKQIGRLSKHPAVRERINEIFRQWVRESGLDGVVIEGRDITTVVAPEAPVRIILTASPDVRAKRRQGDLPGLSFEEVKADLAARDEKDLKVVDFINPAPGVTLIDTSDLDFEASIAAVIDVVRSVRDHR